MLTDGACGAGAGGEEEGAGAGPGEEEVGWTSNWPLDGAIF